MRTQILLGLFLPAICFAQGSVPDQRLHQLAIFLQLQILTHKPALPPIPQIVYHPKLPANARYDSGKILVGDIQADYHTTGDSLSILFHEYHHHLQEKKGLFPICEDSLGNIPQWSTGEKYFYQPKEAEVERELKQAIGPWINRYEEPRRSAEIARLRRDLSQPREVLFVYAPSRLAEAEIDAYQAQLRAAQLGLYVLSQEAEAAIYRRLEQLNQTLKRRIAYEQLHQLRADGCNQQK